MQAAAPSHMARVPTAILLALLLLAGAAWTVLAWQSARMDTEHMGHAEMLTTMDMRAVLFLAIWAAMMVAIMFPTAAPMILTFARVQAGRRQQGKPVVPTFIFTGTYLALWVAFGALAYGAAVAAQELAEQSTWFMDNMARIGGGVLITAGVYQLTPLKKICLSKCRSPLSFILGAWRDGYRGAVRMGLEHGLYCIGCCWLLFLIIFPLGTMNIAVLAAITALIFAEKSLPFGHQASVAAAGLLVAYGALVVFVPDALPTMA
jgi:predicted metal-binding membrane protein